MLNVTLGSGPVRAHLASHNINSKILHRAVNRSIKQKTTSSSYISLLGFVFLVRRHVHLPKIESWRGNFCLRRRVSLSFGAWVRRVLINLSYPVGSTSEPRAFEGGHQGCETKRTAAATAEEGKEEGEENWGYLLKNYFSWSVPVCWE